jgi:nitrogen fixation protein FixH
LIAFFGTVVVSAVALVLMLVAHERWPMLVVKTALLASITFWKDYQAEMALAA